MPKQPPSIAARKVVDFVEVIGQRHCISAAVGPQLDPVVLSRASPPEEGRERSDGASFGKQRGDRRNQFAIHYRVGEAWREVDLPNTNENYHIAQPLGNDRWLVVRCRSEGDNDRNAHVFDANGRKLCSFPAGDGIQDVQADEAGRIWSAISTRGSLAIAS
jgi:hypothetical protein